MAFTGFPVIGDGTGLKAVLGPGWATENNLIEGTILVLEPITQSASTETYSENGTDTGDRQSNRFKIQLYVSGSAYRTFLAADASNNFDMIGYQYGSLTLISANDYSFGEMQAWTTAQWVGGSWWSWSPWLDSASVNHVDMLSALTIAPLNTFQITQGGTILPNGAEYWGYEHGTLMYSGDGDVTITFVVENLGEGELAVDSVTLGEDNDGDFALDGTNAVTAGTIIAASGSANLVVKWTNPDQHSPMSKRTMITVSTSAGDYVFPFQVNQFGACAGNGTKAYKHVLTGAQWNDNPYSTNDIIYTRLVLEDGAYNGTLSYSEDGTKDPSPTNRLHFNFTNTYTTTGASAYRYVTGYVASGTAMDTWQYGNFSYYNTTASNHPYAPTTWTSYAFGQWLTFFTSGDSRWNYSYLSNLNAFFTTPVSNFLYEWSTIFTTTNATDSGTLQITQEGRVLSDAAGSYHIGTRVSAGVATATKRTWTFTIENTDVTDGLTISGITAPSGFTIDQDTAFLGPGETLDVTVEIAGGDPAELSGDIHIHSSDNADFTIPITGTRVVQPSTPQIIA